MSTMRNSPNSTMTYGFHHPVNVARQNRKAIENDVAALRARIRKLQNEEALSRSRSARIQKKATQLEENSHNRTINHAMWVQARQEGRHPLSQNTGRDFERPHTASLRSNRSLSTHGSSNRAFNSDATEFIPPPVHPDELKAWVSQRKFEKDSMTNISRERTYQQRLMDADEQRQMRQQRRMEYDEQRRQRWERNHSTVQRVRAQSAHARTARAHRLQEKQYAALEHTHRRVLEQEQLAMDAAASIEKLRQEEAVLLQRMQRAFDEEVQVVDRFEKAAIGGTPLPLRISPAGTGFYAGSDLLLLPTGTLAQTGKSTSVLGQEYIRSQRMMRHSTHSPLQTHTIHRSPVSSPLQTTPGTPGSVSSPYIPASSYKSMHTPTRNFTYSSPRMASATSPGTPTSTRSTRYNPVSPFRTPEPRGTFFSNSVNLSPASVQFSQSNSPAMPQYQQRRPMTSPSMSRQPSFTGASHVPGTPRTPGDSRGTATLDAARDALLRSSRKNGTTPGEPSTSSTPNSTRKNRNTKGKASHNSDVPLNSLLPNLFQNPGSVRR